MFINKRIFNDSDNSDYIYYNADLIPNTKDVTHSHSQIAYSDSLINPIVETASDYEFAIEKAQFDASTLPLWIPLLDTTVNDGATTVYSVYMWTSAGGINAGPVTQPLVYSNSNYQIFHSPNSNDNFSNPYYWVNTFESFVNLLNATISTAYNTCKMQLVDDGATVISNCPFVQYNSNTQLFSIYFDKNSIPNGTGGTIILGFNTHLQLLLRHFNYSLTNLTTDVAYELQPVDNYGLNSYSYNGVDYVVLQQEASSTEYFNPISNIVFTTQSLPIEGEIVGPPKTLTESSYSLTSLSSSEKIITDITMPMSSPFDYKEIITYIPTQYRWLSMAGGEIKNFSFRIYWKCKYNAVIYPCNMSSIGFCSVKVVFRKK